MLTVKIGIIARTYDPEALVTNLLNVYFDEEVTAYDVAIPRHWNIDRPSLGSLAEIREWVEVNSLGIAEVKYRGRDRRRAWHGRFELRIARLAEIPARETTRTADPFAIPI